MKLPMKLKKQHAAYGLIALAGLFCLAFAIFLSKWGVGISGDTDFYFEVARSLKQFNGVSIDGEVITHYPPGYSIILAVISVFTGGNVEMAATFWMVVCFVLTFVLLGVNMSLSTRHSIGAVFIALWLLLGLSCYHRVLATALTEGTYCVLIYTTVILWTLGLLKQRNWMLIASAALLGYAVILRYVGVTLLPSVIMALWLFGHGSLRRRLTQSVWLGAIMVTPLLLWIVHNALFAESLTNRAMKMHLIGMNKIRGGVSTLHDIIFVQGMPWHQEAIHVAIFLGLMLVGLALLGWRCRPLREKLSYGHIIAFIFVTHIIIYVGFLIFSISFMDALTYLNTRMLLPAILPLVVVFIWILWALAKEFQREYVWAIFMTVTFLIGLQNWPLSIANAIKQRSQGVHYEGPKFRDSETISFVRDWPGQALVYSNGHDVLRMYTDKTTERLPAVYNPFMVVDNEEYPAEIAAIVEQVQAGQAIIVHLRPTASRKFLPTEESLRKLGLTIIGEFEDGVVFGPSLDNNSNLED